MDNRHDSSRASTHILPVERHNQLGCCPGGASGPRAELPWRRRIQQAERTLLGATAHATKAERGEWENERTRRKETMMPEGWRRREGGAGGSLGPDPEGRTCTDRGRRPAPGPDRGVHSGHQEMAVGGKQTEHGGVDSIVRNHNFLLKSRLRSQIPPSTCLFHSVALILIFKLNANTWKWRVTASLE